MKPVLDGKYFVTADGEVYSTKRTRVPKKLKKREHLGYYYTSLSVNGKHFLTRTHRLIMLGFYGKSSLTVNHKDGNKLNNRLENLEYCSMAENRRHASRLNLSPVGERVGTSKLKNSDVFKIRELIASGKSCASIARMYGVTDNCILLIKNKKRWGSVVKAQTGHK